MRNYLLLIALILAGVVFAQQPAQNVVAKVNDIEITAEDIMTGESDKMMMESQAGATNMRKPRGQRQMDINQAEWMLEQTINQALMLREAEKSGMAKDADVLAMVEAYKRAIMVQTYINKVLYEQVKPSEEELRKEYEQPGRFQIDAHAQIIRAWGSTEQEVRTRLDEMKKQMQSGEQRYEQMFFHELEHQRKMKEQDASGGNASSTQRRGDNEGKSDMVERVNKAKAGELVGPIQLDEHQWVLIEVVKQVPAGKRPFDEVREEIERVLIEERLRKAQQDKVAELRKSATVTIFYENLNKAFGK